MSSIVGRIALVVAAAGLLVAARPAICLGLQGPQPGAVSAAKLSLPDRPGSVRGLADAASINAFSGQISYSVPLELPSGAAGFGPHLAFSYTGELGNGPLGIGWTVGEIAVRRSLRLGVPSYSDGDQLDLIGIGDDSRLVPAGDGVTYWLSGQAKTVRVRRQGARFEVKDQNGTTYLLGATPQGRQADGDRVAAWLVESATNVAGQTVAFSYDQDQGQVYLRSIVWGPNKQFRVDLNYDGRTDVVTSYRTGFLVRTARRLVSVVVWAAGSDGAKQVVRTYTLGFDPNASASRLVTLQMTGRPAGGVSPESLAPLTFTYARPELARTALLGGTDGWVLTQRGVTLLDVDGDGMSDLVRMELGNHQYRKNRGGSFADAATISGATDIELEGAQLMDLDGDTRPELVTIVNDTWRVRTLAGGSWQMMGVWPGTNGVPLQAAGSALADLNGDGRTDVIRAGTGGLLVNFNSAQGLGPTLSLPPISKSEAVVEPGSANVQFVDFNGDGLADVVYLTDAWMKVYLGRGDGTFVTWVRDFYPWGTAAFAANELHVTDLDRDGTMDLVRISDGHVFWYPGLPNGHVGDTERHLPRPESVDADAVVTIADVNGNGSQEIVWSSPRGMWALDLAGAATGGMLESINNGMGKTTRFFYRASAQLAADAEVAGEPWTQKLASSIAVPVRSEIDLGPSAPLRVVHHGVRDGFWDSVERRFGGFLGATESAVSAKGPAATLVVKTHFHAGIGDDRVLRGRPWLIERLDGTGALFDTQKADWQSMVISGMPDTPYARRAVKLQDEGYFFEGVSAPRHTQTTYGFDSQGRTTRETHFGLLDIIGDEKEIERLFADDDTTWVRDRVYTETVSDGQGAVASSQQIYFGPLSGAELPLGTVGPGFLRRTAAFLDTTNSWPTQSSLVYDACGNVTTSYESGVTRSIGYQDCLFAVSETTQPGGGKPALTWSMTWDPVLGVPLTMTDPNLDVTTVTYDTLARPLSIATGGQQAHIHYAYDWIRADPRTTTWVFDGMASALATEAWPTGPHWRRSVAVSNGAGEALYSSTPLADGRFIIGQWNERDERGQVVLGAESFYSTLAFPSQRAADARVQVMVYDGQGRIKQKTLPNGATTAHTYAAFRLTVSSPELADVTSELDGLSRARHTERTVNGIVESVTAAYDPADRMLSMSLQDGAAVHTFGYDTLGRLRDAADPDTGPRHLTYDDRNLLVQHQNGAGQSIYFDYDGAARLIRRGETAQPNAATDYSYVYDDGSAALADGCHAGGRMVKAIEPGGVLRLCYDVFGKESGFSRTIAPEGIAARTGGEQYLQSPSGLLLQTSADDGFAVAYGYDGAGRVQCLRPPPLDGAGHCATRTRGQVGPSVEDFWVADEVDASGRIIREHYQNGVAQNTNYDVLGMPDGIDLVRPSATGPIDLFDISIQRNVFGAPGIVTDWDQRGLNHSAAYKYDRAGRLTDATIGPVPIDPEQPPPGPGDTFYTFAYRYDGLQNMTFRQASGPRYIGALAGVYHYGNSAHPRQLTSITPGSAP